MKIPVRAIQVAAGVLAATALAGAAWYGYEALTSHPVRRVLYAGSAERVAAADLEALAQSIRSSRGRTSLAEIREAARRIPWVREASVRRRFPDAVEISLEAHEALARWNDDALLGTRGEIFRADTNAELPRLRGADAAAAAMAKQYPGLAKAAAPLASAIAEARRSPRGAWQLRLESGLVLELGRGDVEPRLARFAAAWPALAARGVAPSHADLRYPNGFALRMAGRRP